MYKDLLTIVVPTHNRIKELMRCIDSIMHIFPNINIIIGDNSNIAYHKIDNDMFNNNNIQIINLRNDEGNIFYVYKTIVEAVKTPYVLIVEDDDYLINSDIHYSIINDFIEKNNNIVVSFSGITETNEYVLNHIFFGTFFDIPFFWNGNFQFGLCYYPTNNLLSSIIEWFHFDQTHILDGSYDEAIALLTIQKSKKYIHIPKVGEIIGIFTDNMSWNNSKNRIFSSSTYIDDLSKILHMPKSWNYKYKLCQMHDMHDEYDNISYDFLFNNKDLIDIRDKMRLLFNKKSILEIKQQLNIELDNLMNSKK